MYYAKYIKYKNKVSIFKISNNIYNFSIIDNYSKYFIFHFINFTTEIYLTPIMIDQKLLIKNNYHVINGLNIMFLVNLSLKINNLI